MHKVLARLLTKENVESLGFVDWNKIEGLVERAFEKEEALAMRYAFTVSQWVVLSQRFGIKKMLPPRGWEKFGGLDAQGRGGGVNKEVHNRN